jgi:hypothetical protein
VPAGEFIIEAVRFGVEEATANGISVEVVLYTDNQCPPDRGREPIEIARQGVAVDLADEGTQLTVQFPSAPVLPANSDLVVEIAQVDDGVAGSFAFLPMSNPAGQCGPSYIRAPDCGALDWTDLADFAPGFPDAHLIQLVNPHLTPTPIPTPSATPTATSTPTATPTPSPELCGDVNRSGSVNIGDALLAGQFDVGLRECGVAPFDGEENCDVAPAPAGNGSCNIGDALFMGQCDVGLRSCNFSCTPFACPAAAAAAE